MAFTDANVRAQLIGHEIGGGDGWEPDVHPADADVEVRTLSQLKSALSGSADIVAVSDDAAINVEGEHMNLDLGNKILVSYRGWDGKTGGLIYSTREGYVGSRPFTALYSFGRDPQIHGFRLRGASADRTSWIPAGSSNYDNHLSRAVMLRGTGGRVSNCVLSGWNWNCIHLKGQTSNGTLTRAEIDHCVQVRSKQMGYGYGTDIWLGFGNIHHNYYNDMRHCIDGFGWYNSGYDIHHNVFGPDQYIHPVDMHCLNENGSSSSQTNPSHQRWALRAGGKLTIRENQFTTHTSTSGRSLNAIAVRGVPYDYCNIEGNWFTHSRRPERNTGNSNPGEAWRQVNVLSSSYGTIDLDSRGFSRNFRDSGNEFGVETLQLDQLGDTRDDIVTEPTPVEPEIDPDYDRNRAWARSLENVGTSLKRVRDTLAETA